MKRTQKHRPTASKVHKCVHDSRVATFDIGDEITAPADTVDGFDEFRRSLPSDTCSSLATSGDNADVNR